MTKTKLPDKDFGWNPELAYAIGLLVTDGCLSNDGRHIIMRSSDFDLLETFKNCIKIDNRICRTVNKNVYSYRVQFGNVQFYNWLMKIGLKPAKTYTIKEIKIPDVFFKDFLRGHLDGDGSILGYEDKYNSYRGRTYKNNRLFVRFISASKIHTLWLHRKITALAGVKGAFLTRKPHQPNRVPIYEIKFAKRESLKLLGWIYYRPNLPTLLRKRLLAEQLIKRVKNEARKPYAFVVN
ncbi:MAG: hypothetical protein HY433_02245 [Candidatus Liptonbacteria bacterium]|nr:hypothetical protein [Parcubacteria group bacterium]MBI4086041.1 hypothetical protein [Candidatus Liptonbacteria bacterium]